MSCEWGHRQHFECQHLELLLTNRPMPMPALEHQENSKHGCIQTVWSAGPPDAPKVRARGAQDEGVPNCSYCLGWERQEPSGMSPPKGCKAAGKKSVQKHRPVIWVAGRAAHCVSRIKIQLTSVPGLDPPKVNLSRLAIARSLLGSQSPHTAS